MSLGQILNLKWKYRRYILAIPCLIILWILKYYYFIVLVPVLLIAILYYKIQFPKPIKLAIRWVEAPAVMPPYVLPLGRRRSLTPAGEGHRKAGLELEPKRSVAQPHRPHFSPSGQSCRKGSQPERLPTSSPGTKP